MREHRTRLRNSTAGVLVLFSILLAGCGSTVVNGLLEYPDESVPTAGDSVYVRLYGSDTCGATILNVGEDHRWQYPPKDKRRNLRLWSAAPLPPLKPRKGGDAPTFMFQAMKPEDTVVISTQVESVQYPAYMALPKKDRVIRLVYERAPTPTPAPPVEDDSDVGKIGQ
jgi:hypothetical protein